MNFLVAAEYTSRAEKCSAHSQSMSELAQRRELREAEKPEGLLLECLTFQRTAHERAGKAPAEAHALGPAAARLCDGGTAECGIVPSRYLHQRARRGKALSQTRQDLKANLAT